MEVIKNKTMKTNHKQTYSYISAFTPLLRYVTTRNLAIAMFIAVALLGTTRGNETEKPALATGEAKAGQLSQGSLVVYSATDAFEDGDVPYYAHSSYAIYTTDGKLFKNVENHISNSDEIPEVVTLPGGIVRDRSSIGDGWICPSTRRYQGRPANNPRLGFRRGITQRDRTRLSVGKSPQGFTKNRMNPFDLKAALLAKHAQHPVIIHFPIALFIISVAFDLLAIWKRNPVLAKAAFYNLIGAALTAPVAIASGLTAWQWQLEGSKLKGNLLLHLLFALAASGMIWLLSGWRISQRKLPQRTPGLTLYPACPCHGLVDRNRRTSRRVCQRS